MPTMPKYQKCQACKNNEPTRMIEDAEGQLGQICDNCAPAMEKDSGHKSVPLSQAPSNWNFEWRAGSPGAVAKGKHF